MDREFIIILIIFVISSIVTALLPESTRSNIVNSVKESLKPFNDLARRLGAFSLLVLPVTIFYNNLRIALIALFGGVVLIIPPAIVVYNSYVITAFVMNGNPVLNLTLILPHGILELYAIMLASSLGLKLGLKVVRRAGVVNTLRYGLKRLPHIALLLLIAAFIEVYITPLIYLIIGIITQGG